MFRTLNFGTFFYPNRKDELPMTKVKPHLNDGHNCVWPDGGGLFIDPKSAVYISLTDYKQAEKRSGAYR